MAEPRIVLSAVDQTKAAFAAAQRNMQGLGETAAGLSTRFGTLGIAIAGALSGASLKGGIDMLDKLDDMSEKTGIAVDKLSALRYAGEVTGTPLESLALGVRKLAVNMGEASGAGSEQSRTFKALGIDTKRFAGDTDGMLMALADRFKTFRDGPEKAALAIKAFGKSGEEMIPLLNLGSDGIKRLRSEAESMGAVFGGDLAKRAAEFNDNLKRLSLNADAAKVSIVGQLLPSLSALSEELLVGIQVYGSWWKALLGIGFGASPFDTWAEGAAKARGELERLNAEMAALDSGAPTVTENAGGAAFVGQRSGINRGKRRAGVQAQISEQEKRFTYFNRLNSLQINREAKGLEEAFWGGPPVKANAPGVKPAPDTSAQSYLAQLAKEYGALTGSATKYDEVQERLAINADKFSASQKTQALSLAAKIDAQNRASSAADNMARVLSAELGAQEAATETHYAAVEPLANLAREMAFEVTLLNKMPEFIERARLQRELDNRERVAEAALVARGLQLGWDEIRMEAERARIKGLSADALAAFNKRQADARDKQHNPQRGIADAAKEYLDDIAKTGDAAAAATTRALKGTEDALTDMLTTGKLNTKSLVDSMISDFMRLNVVRPLMNSLVGGAGGAADNFFGSLFGSVPGHADGLANVPYDNYLARLHKGERVLTAKENKQGAGQAINIVINNNIGSVASKSDVVAGMQTVRAQIIGQLVRSQRMGGAVG